MAFRTIKRIKTPTLVSVKLEKLIERGLELSEEYDLDEMATETVALDAHGEPQSTRDDYGNAFDTGYRVGYLAQAWKSPVVYYDSHYAGSRRHFFHGTEAQIIRRLVSAWQLKWDKRAQEWVRR